MFNQREALNREKHADLKFEPNLGYRFAASEMIIPIVSGEVTAVARDYVIVFSKERPVVNALLGITEGENAYVTEKGQWRGRYKPALIRAYPFALVKTPGQEDRPPEKSNYTIIIDPEAQQLRDPDGQPLFDGDGEPTALVAKIQKVLMSLQQDAIRTERLIRQLEEHELLVERHIEVKSRDTALTGFRVVDQKALAGLAPDVLAQLRDSGALMLAYAQMMSQTNLTDSPLAWSAKADTDRSPSEKLKSLFDDDGDFGLDFLH